ncbi:MAG: glycosyltransferase family 39 protein [Acidobacteriota bacterium]
MEDNDLPSPSSDETTDPPRDDSTSSPFGSTRRVLVLLLALAAVFRLAHFTALLDSPLVELHRWESSDMAFFSEWAEQVAGGDWWTDVVLHPFHEWHFEAAQQHFAAHPEDRQRHEQAITAGRALGPPERAQVNEWFGGKRLHQGPVYSYLLAATRTLLGPNVRWVLAGQLLLGVLVTGLIFGLTRRCLGEHEAVVAGVLAALAPLPVHFETVLLRTTLLSVLAFLFSWLFVRALELGGVRCWLLAGVVAGAGVLAKPSLVLLPVLAVAWLVLELVRRRRRLREVGVATLLMVAGTVACSAPLIVRNVRVGVAPLSISSVGAFTFVQANASDVRPDRHEVISRHCGEILGASEGRLFETMRLTYETWDGPGGYLLNTLRKLDLTCHWHEAPNNSNFYFHQRWSTALRWSPFGFRLLAPFCLVGLVLAARRWRRCGPLLIPVLGLLAPLLIFQVVARFRCPWQLSLLPFAAVTVITLVSLWNKQSWRRLGVLVLALAVVAAWTARPLPAGRTLVRATDFALAVKLDVGARVAELERQQDLAGVADAWADLLSRRPSWVDELGPERLAQSEDEAELAGVLAVLHRRHADALARIGSPDAAVAARQRAAELEHAAGTPSG